jgi:hypothetical protein
MIGIAYNGKFEFGRSRDSLQQLVYFRRVQKHPELQTNGYLDRIIVGVLHVAIRRGTGKMCG